MCRRPPRVPPSTHQSSAYDRQAAAASSSVPPDRSCVRTMCSYCTTRALPAIEAGRTHRRLSRSASPDCSRRPSRVEALCSSTSSGRVLGLCLMPMSNRRMRLNRRRLQRVSNRFRRGLWKQWCESHYRNKARRYRVLRAQQWSALRSCKSELQRNCSRVSSELLLSGRKAS